MYFITCRQPVKNDGNFKFDLTNNAPSNHVYFCERQSESEYKEIGHCLLMTALKEHSCKQLLFYIHGFNNLPERDIFTDVDKLQNRLGNETLVIPVIWACDNKKGIVRDYYSDQQSADDSGTALSRALQKMLAWQSETKPCLKRMNILAHSMGNRVLRETLHTWRDRFHPYGVPLMFRNIFMFAPDLVNETLSRGKSGEPICHTSRQVHVFYAADDLALRGSKIANVRNGTASRRLGHTGCENDNVPDNVYQYDCDSFNSEYDKKGHSYFLTKEAVEIMINKM